MLLGEQDTHQKLQSLKTVLILQAHTLSQILGVFALLGLALVSI